MARHTNGTATPTVNGSADPEADPPLFAYGPRPPVTRLNRRTLVLLAVATAGVALAALTVTSGDGGGGRPRNGVADESAVRPSGPVESESVREGRRRSQVAGSVRRQK